MVGSPGGSRNRQTVPDRALTPRPSSRPQSVSVVVRLDLEKWDEDWGGGANSGYLRVSFPDRCRFPMTERDPQILSNAEAARVWERAAQLQAEAAGRVEAPGVQGPTIPPLGLFAHSCALRGHRGRHRQRIRRGCTGRPARWTHAVKGEKGPFRCQEIPQPSAETIIARRVVEVTLRELLSAMEAILPSEPFRLTLSDRHGDPLDGGVLVFDIQGTTTPFPQGFALAAKDVGLRQVFVSLRPSEGATSSCEITVHSPVMSHKVGFAVGLVATAIAGGVGASFSLGSGWRPGLDRSLRSGESCSAVAWAQRDSGRSTVSLCVEPEGARRTHRRRGNAGQRCLARQLGGRSTDTGA